MRKRPAFLKKDKRIFLVSISTEYWCLTNHRWPSLCLEDRQSYMAKIYSDIESALTANKETLIIFAPIHLDKMMIDVRQITGKKRSRISFISNPAAANT